MNKKDYLIVGQGVAGSFLAWNLIKKGKSVVVVDNNHEDCSSFAAAGMINPITGKRLVLSARSNGLLPFAKDVYCELEQQFGRRFFEARDILRLFKDQSQLQEWQKKHAMSHLKEYYGDKQDAGMYGETINDEWGSFLTLKGGYCRTNELMQSFTDYFLELGVLRPTRFDFGECLIGEGEIQWRGESFTRVVFAEGYQAKDNPFFSWLPFNLAKGEILTLRADDPRMLDAVISCGKWCIPNGDHTYTVGSTYGWDRFDTTITEAAKEEILRDIAHFIKIDFEVIDQAAGVRPIMKDLKPAMGAHPNTKNVFIFNGLASKGLLWGPFYANQMVQYLEENVALEDEVNIKRFCAKHFKS